MKTSNKIIEIKRIEILNYSKNVFLSGNYFLLIVAFLSFIFHPYITLLIAAVVQVFIKIKSYIFIPIYSLALVFYWSMRKIGISWSTGKDDIPAYISYFLETRNQSFLDLFNAFIETPFGREIGFSILNYLIGIITSNEFIYLFIIYLLILSLLFCCSVKVSKRYFLIYFFLVFFGLGGFAQQGGLHLIRSSIAALIFFYGLLINDENNKLSLFFIIFSGLVHLAILPIALFSVFFIKSKFFSNWFVIIISSFLTAAFVSYLVSIYDLEFLESRLLYIQDGSFELVNIIQIFLILAISLILNYKDKNKIFLFSIWIILFVNLMFVFLPSFSFILNRYLFILSFFIAFLLFKIIIKIKYKPILVLILLALFIRKFNVLSKSEFIENAFYNDFSNLISFYIKTIF